MHIRTADWLKGAKKITVYKKRHTRKRLEQKFEALRQTHEKRERWLQKQTAELTTANVALQAEIKERKRAEQLARRQTEALTRTFNALSCDPDLDKFLGQVLLTIAEQFRAAASTLWFWDETGTSSLHMSCYQGQILPGEQIFHRFGAPQKSYSMYDNPVRQEILRTRCPVAIALDDERLHPEHQEWIASLGIKALLAVPVLRGDSIIGSLNIHNTSGDRFTPEEIELAQALAHQATLAIQLTRLAEQAVVPLSQPRFQLTTSSEPKGNARLTRILIADDHPVVREGVAAILEREPDMTVIAQANNGQEALDLFGQHQPDVGLIDLRMPRMNGVEAITAIRVEFPDAQLVVLTTYDSDEDIYRGLRAGAKGYLLKDAPCEELLECIRTVHKGQSYIPPGVGAKLVEQMSSPQLSDREREVLCLMAVSKSNQEIGAALGIAESTVKFHVSNILSKLQVKDRMQAAIAALKRGIISL